MAGLVEQDDALEAERLTFVTETEASAYFGLDYSKDTAIQGQSVSLGS